MTGVGAPLGLGYRESVLWQEGVAAESVTSTSPLEVGLPAEVDVVIVGGGYCGLSAATELARTGRSVVVLERGELGSGASTRNGGMVIPELKAGPLTLERRYGELGRRMHAEVEQAFDHVESLVADEAGAPVVECGYERTGQLYLTHGDRGVARLHGLAAEHRAVGSPAHVVTGDELIAETGSLLFSAGLVLERTGGLDPARFHQGLAERALRCGAALRPHVAALGIERDSSDRPVVRTSAGPVTAADVLLATNAYADGVEPRLRRRVLPMSSFIIATEPLDVDVAATVLPTRRMAFNDRNLLWYWRHGPDGRLLFGGRRSLGRVDLAEAREHLYAAMVQVHPQLHGVRVDRVWGGQVALTVDRLPHCGVDARVWYATGCNGSGVALNTWLGHRVAGAILGAALPPFAELHHRAVPLRPARRAWLPVVGAWFAHSDRRDARRAA